MNNNGNNRSSGMAKELDIMELYQVIRDNLNKIVFFTILGGIITFLLCSYVLTPRYQSYIDLYVTNTSASQQSTELETVNANDITASQKLVSTYKLILQTDSAVNRVLKIIGEDLSKADLLRMVSFSVLENTEILRITATTDDPYLSAKICNGYAAIASETVTDVMNGGNVKILSSAVPSGKPSFPNTTRFCIIGFIFSFLLASFIYILFSLFSNIIKGEDEFKKKSDLPMLGAVPDFFSLREVDIPTAVKRANKQIKKNGADDKLITRYTLLSKDSPFVVTESYNLIRTNLLLSDVSLDNHIVIISSPLPNECKSTTAANLGISMAENGNKVLIIEGDVRNASLHRIFRVSNSHGLSRLLAGLDSLDDTVIHDVVPGLDLIPGGPKTPNPSEILGSDKMKKLLHKLSKQYDYVFIDTPPLNVVADAILLANIASGMIFVVRENKTRYSDLDAAVEKINATQCRILGVIISDSEKQSKGYKNGRYGYGYGYGYGSSASSSSGNDKK